MLVLKFCLRFELRCTAITGIQLEPSKKGCILNFFHSILNFVLMKCNCLQLWTPVMVNIMNAGYGQNYEHQLWSQLWTPFMVVTMNADYDCDYYECRLWSQLLWMQIMIMVMNADYDRCWLWLWLWTLVLVTIIMPILAMIMSTIMIAIMNAGYGHNLETLFLQPLRVGCNPVVAEENFHPTPYKLKLKKLKLCIYIAPFNWLCPTKGTLHVTCNFPAQALSTVSFLYEGEPPPPISTPWGAYRPPGCL